MKYFSIIISLLTLSTLLSLFFINSNEVRAIDYANTQAISVIGQPDFNQNLSYRKGLSSPTSVHSTNDKLYISDYGTCRVLGYDNLPTANHPTVDIAIGKNSTDINCVNFGIATSQNNGEIKRVITSGNKMFMLDGGHNRVLIYNTIPTSTNAVADVVLGQPNFTTATINTGGISASTLNIRANPINSGDLYVDGTKLYVADSANNRILIWNTIPTVSNTPADVVLGQPDFTSDIENNGGISASRLNNPKGIIVDSGKLYVSDTSNNRILIWNSIPTVSDTPADVVLGQPNFTSSTANSGGLSATSLSNPLKLSVQNGKLFVPDSSNNRLLIWNTVPAVNGISANVVLGQPNFTSGTANNGGLSASSLSTPIHSQIIDSKLYVVDSANHRVKVYNTIPTTNNVSADIVIGQADFTQGWIKNGGTDIFNGPNHLITTEGKFIVADSYNRVLIWNTIPTSTYPLVPDVILGQPNMTSNTVNNGGLSASSFSSPRHPTSCGSKFVISDWTNHRILIWNSIPTTSNAPADVVLGQPDFISNTPNNGGRSASSLNYPRQPICFDNKLLVNDYGNHRLLIWNTIPTISNVPADTVIGQSNFTDGILNSGGLSGKSLYGPVSSAVTQNGELVTVDFLNHRVLIWNSVPTTDFAEADLVIGQPNLTSNTNNNGGISSSTLYWPQYVYSDGLKLFISDGQNNRVLGFNSIPTSNFAPADFVIGQEDFISAEESVSITKLRNPYIVSTYSNKLYVSDGNDRVIVFPIGPQNETLASPNKSTSRNITIQLSATDAKEMLISADSNFSGAVWETYSTTKEILLSAGDGEKQIFAKYRDYTNYEGEVLSTTTILDTTGPEGAVRIVSPYNNGFTSSTNVTLRINATDVLNGVTHMEISSSSNFADSAWVPYNTTKAWTLSDGDGRKIVYAKFKDSLNNESNVYRSSIILDTTTSLNLRKINDNDYQDGVIYKIESRPLITGKGEAGSLVSIIWNDKLIGETVVKSDGTWSWTPTDELGNGVYALTITQTDQAGNTAMTDLNLEVTGNSTDTDNDDVDYPPVIDNPTDEDKDDTDKETARTTNYTAYVYALIGIFTLMILILFAKRNRESKK